MEVGNGLFGFSAVPFRLNKTVYWKIYYYSTYPKQEVEMSPYAFLLQFLCRIVGCPREEPQQK
jgi:hypothetical protein